MAFSHRSDVRAAAPPALIPSEGMEKGNFSVIAAATLISRQRSRKCSGYDREQVFQEPHQRAAWRAS